MKLRKAVKIKQRCRPTVHCILLDNVLYLPTSAKKYNSLNYGLGGGKTVASLVSRYEQR